MNPDRGWRNGYFSRRTWVRDTLREIALLVAAKLQEKK